MPDLAGTITSIRAAGLLRPGAGRGPVVGRAQEVATYSTMTRSLLGLADWLRELGISGVVMEATSDYWKRHGYSAAPRKMKAGGG